MSNEDVRREILREWRSLPAEERATESQAATFAARAAQEHRNEIRFGGDKYQIIKVWLKDEVGKP